MAKYVYPAIFTPEQGGFSVAFPDIETCFTEGDSLVEAVDNANDALSMILDHMERNRMEIPKASSVAEIQRSVAAGEFVTLVSCDTSEYRRTHDNRAVKKTLSIPSWLNEMAEKAGINFSAALQIALKQQLNIQ